MLDLLILNGRMVNEGVIGETDLAIRDGRIEAMGGDLQHRPARTTLDASGLLLLPGLIDDQVHFREPGLTHKGDMASESRAAVAGGITSFMEMPNCQPPTTSHQALLEKHRLAASKSVANYAFYFGASNQNLAEILALDTRLACGIKVFMGASTGDMLVDDPKTLEQIFANSPLLIATHCEDTPTILANEARFRQQHGEQIPIECHPLIRSEEACYRSSSLAVELAKRHGTRLHVLHLTTARELALFSAGPLADKRITAEVCVHHLFFSDGDYRNKGTLIKCNPAIKQESDRLALLQAVRDDRIDIIATDHAPHLLDEKARPYAQAPSGLPLVQDALLVLLELVQQGQLTLEQVVAKSSHRVAELFAIRDRGYLREGYHADLVLVDPLTPTEVTRTKVLSKCGWSPFEGHRFTHSIHTTLVNGQILYRRGQPVADITALPLQFRRD
ncbi:MAG TPA: dihydroorotase [Pseudomonadales bacterium]|jgi:dihydroorotase|nr:dihydroorotase [Pseudomonadales bacterium]HMW14532.1 dihydroorotase [Pseudomonadales bacterium]HMW82323.1 dihydroorotase [Pseudomonadales bacterium]HMZ70635.1 dihydroorotase [Pseudomonadales bacterium]HNC76155.1 dihydroorotase [Pseudomonadales bacterium]